MADSYVYFSQSLIKFEKYSEVTNVFFDEANKQVCIKKVYGSTGFYNFFFSCLQFDLEALWELKYKARLRTYVTVFECKTRGQ